MQELNFEYGEEAAEELVRQILFGKSRRAMIIAPSLRSAKWMVERIREIIGQNPILRDMRFFPTYEISKQKVKFPNGAEIYLYPSDNSDRLRGVLTDTAVILAPDAWEDKDMLEVISLCNRLGDNPVLISAYK